MAIPLEIRSSGKISICSRLLSRERPCADYALTDPAVMPARKYLWATMYITKIGSEPSMLMAIISFHW